ncbi:MAG: hypothetical protein P1V51_21330 [Deltaproteobacteria bacterium]|nr:hypothetical protein [Deltaproteobacteria bacterium]
MSPNPPRASSRAGGVRLLLGALALCAALPSPARGARPLSNFPLELGQRIDDAPALVDVDGDGRLEVMVSAGSELHLLDARGESRYGFPLRGDADLVGAPAMVRTAEGAMVLVISAAGSVIVVDGNGKAVPGFPLRELGRPSGGGALFDLDGDGRPEVVFATREGKLHALHTDGRRGGKPLGGFPVKLATELSSPPTFADLGRLEARRVVLIGGSDGAVHAVDGAGRILEAFRPSSRFEVKAAPVSGDVEGDGEAEVAFGSGDFKVYLAGADGALRPGFPVATGYRIRAAPALVDLDGDGRLELVFASGDGKIYALDARGKPVKGFPVTSPGKLEAGVVAGDLVGDERPELVTVTRRGELVVLQADGKPVPGWDASLGAEVTATPALGDLDGNGSLDIAVGTMTGRVALFTGRGARRGRAHWPDDLHGAARSGWLHPSPTRFVDLLLTPEGATTLEVLKAGFAHLDLDRKPLAGVRLEWLRGGEPVPALDGKREVPPSATRKGERWRFRISDPADGEQAITFEAPEVTIRNTPPTSPGILLGPEEARSGEPIELRVVQAAADVDGEALTYEHAWWRNGEPVSLPPDATRAPGEQVRKGDEWTVEVRARDSEDRSVPARATLRVANTPPPGAPLALFPAAPRVTEAIEARVTIPEADVDGDPLHPHYAWRIDGVAVGRPSAEGTLPAGLAGKHQLVEVRLTLDDGEVEGPATEARVEVANTPPGAPGVAIAPARPRTGEALRARITEPPADPDLDPIRLSYAWSLDGEPTTLVGIEVPGERVKAGQRWQVKVTPADDEAAGTAGEASLEVIQSPPRPPLIAIEPLRPVPGEALEGVVREAAVDRDGDPVELRWAWKKGGELLHRGPALPAGKTRRGETWALVATPFDGKVEGRPAQAAVIIGNRPPNAPIVTLAPPKPVGGQPLRAEVTLVGDPDEDPVEARLQWWLDGERIVELDDAREVPGSRVSHFQTWEVTLQADDVELRSKAVRATARVEDRPPEPLATRVEPAKALTTSELTCVALRAARDPDGDETLLRHHWLRGGQETSWEGEVLPAAATRKGERWSCRITTSALELSTPGKLSKPVEILNSGPVAGAVGIEPAEPLTEDDLHCVVKEPFTDPDRDPLELRFVWTRKGQKTRHKGRVLPSRLTRKGEQWSCEVSASDGKEVSGSARASVSIGNTPPTAPIVELLPTEPGTDRPLRCEIVERSRDPDQDSLSFRFRWYLEGKVQPFAATSVAVPVRLLKAGQTWWCGVAGHDGKAEGAEGRSSRRTLR